MLAESVCSIRGLSNDSVASSRLTWIVDLEVCLDKCQFSWQVEASQMAHLKMKSNCPSDQVGPEPDVDRSMSCCEFMTSIARRLDIVVT